MLRPSWGTTFKHWCTVLHTQKNIWNNPPCIYTILYNRQFPIHFPFFPFLFHFFSFWSRVKWADAESFGWLRMLNKSLQYVNYCNLTTHIYFIQEITSTRDNMWICFIVFLYCNNERNVASIFIFILLNSRSSHFFSTFVVFSINLSIFCTKEEHESSEPLASSPGGKDVLEDVPPFLSPPGNYWVNWKYVRSYYFWSNILFTVSTFLFLASLLIYSFPRINSLHGYKSTFTCHNKLQCVL